MVYPYVLDGTLSGKVMTDAMTVVYLSVDKTTGKVIQRVYRNEDDKKYYTDPDFNDAYTCPESAEIRHYGWAAIPLPPINTASGIRWKPGYQYTYTLNYSNGVGVQDPADPFPGEPIISKVMVEVSEEKEEPWPRVNNFEQGGSVNVTDHIIIE